MKFFSPPQVAKELGVSPEKVLSFIRSGELKAFNLAASLNGRARWKISESELDAFLMRRQAMPLVKVKRAKKPADIVQYF